MICAKPTGKVCICTKADDGIYETDMQRDEAPGGRWPVMGQDCRGTQAPDATSTRRDNEKSSTFRCRKKQQPYR